MLKIFSYVSVKKLTPAPAVVLQVRYEIFSENNILLYTLYLRTVAFEKNHLGFIDTWITDDVFRGHLYAAQFNIQRHDILYSMKNKLKKV